jgi:hypothetical protein
MNIKQILIAFINVILVFPIYAMEQENQKIDPTKFYSIIMPGQNGNGGRLFLKNHIVNTYSTFYQTLQGFEIDLGQDNCMRHFDDQFKKDIKALESKNILLYGVSQGTATLVNWLAEQSKEIQSKVKCLVLEGVLSNGNSAIEHTVEHRFVGNWLGYLPFYRVWMPLAAKVIFPTYNPWWGKQALSSAKKLPKDLPIIIMHHEHDFQLSINDAREFYCTLRESGNNNVYLMEVNNNRSAHHNILETETPMEKMRKIGVIQAIYQKYNLPYMQDAIQSDMQSCIKELQPDVHEVRKRIFESLYNKSFFQNTIDTTSTISLSYLAYKSKSYWK